MLRKKIISILIVIFIILLGFSTNIYAAICEITIDDSTDTTGFVEKDGKLYYVVAINSKTMAANLVGANFQIRYDYSSLKPIELSNNQTLDLGEKGTFKGPMKAANVGLSVNLNQETLIYSATSKEPIEKSEVELVRVCFEVLDGKEERHAVYIDKEDGITNIAQIGLNRNERYITNGVSQEAVSKLDNIMETIKKPITVEYDDGTKETKEIEITPEEKAKEEAAKKAAETAKELSKNNTDYVTEDTANAQKTKDTTVSNKILPNTGVRTALVVIGVLAIIGIITFIKMKKYKNILK